MRSRAAIPPPLARAGASALEELLAAEREIADRLAEADAEGERLLAEARSRCTEREVATQRALTEELEVAERARREEAARAEEMEERLARSECRRFDEATDEELEVLADAALRLVLAVEDGDHAGGAP